KAALAADAAGRSGVQLSTFSARTEHAIVDLLSIDHVTNPVDATGQVVNEPAKWDQLLEVVADDESVDIMVSLMGITAGGSDRKLTDGLLKLTADRPTTKVAVIWPDGELPASSLPYIVA